MNHPVKQKIIFSNRQARKKKHLKINLRKVELIRLFIEIFFEIYLFKIVNKLKSLQSWIWN